MMSFNNFLLILALATDLSLASLDSDSEAGDVELAQFASEQATEIARRFELLGLSSSSSSDIQSFRLNLMSGKYQAPKKIYNKLYELSVSSQFRNIASEDMKDDIAQLIDANIIEPEYCFKEKDLFENIEQLKVKYKSNDQILNYINDCELNRIKVCKKAFRVNFQNTIHYEFDDNTRSMAKELIKTRLELSEHEKEFPIYLRVIQICSKYLRDTNKKPEHITLMITRCQRISAKIRPYMRFHNELKSSDKIDLKDVEKNWFKLVEFCDSLQHIDIYNINQAYIILRNDKWLSTRDFSTLESFWRASQRDLFTSEPHKARKLNPQETLELLRSQLKIYLIDGMNPRTNDIDLRLHYELEKASRASEERCNSQYIHEIELLKASSPTSNKNLNQYLETQLDIQLGICKKKFGSFFESELVNVLNKDPNGSKLLTEFRSHFLNNGMNSLDLTNIIYPPHIDFNWMLRDHYAKDIEDDISANRLIIKAIDSLKSICSLVRGKMNFILDLFDRMNEDEKNKYPQDSEVIIWLGNTRLCEQLTIFRIFNPRQA